MKFVWILTIFNLILSANANEDLSSFVLEFTKQFSPGRFNNFPIIINHSKTVKVKLLKHMSSKNKKVEFLQNHAHLDLQKFALVIFPLQETFKKPRRIDQELYFLSKKWEITEKYVIGKAQIEQNLGHYINSTLSMKSLNSFWKRRSNFQGLHLKALV